MGLFPMSCHAADSMTGLVPVCRPIDSLSVELWVFTHADLRQTARVKVMVDYLVEQLRTMRDLFNGQKAKSAPRVLNDEALNRL